jgi:hypothetical protein
MSVGFILDEVYELQPPIQDGAIPESWVETGGWPDCPQGFPPEPFWRTLVVYRGPNRSNPPHYYGLVCKEPFTRNFFGGFLTIGALISHERSQVTVEFCRRVKAVIWNRSLISTKRNCLGLMSIYTHPRDKICVLFGCSVPVVVQPALISKAELEDDVEKDVKYFRHKVRERILRNWRRHKLWKLNNEGAATKDLAARLQREQRHMDHSLTQKNASHKRKGGTLERVPISKRINGDYRQQDMEHSNSAPATYAGLEEDASWANPQTDSEQPRHQSPTSQPQEASAVA